MQGHTKVQVAIGGIYRSSLVNASKLDRKMNAYIGLKLPQTR